MLVNKSDTMQFGSETYSSDSFSGVVCKALSEADRISLTDTSPDSLRVNLPNFMMEAGEEKLNWRSQHRNFP